MSLLVLCVIAPVKAAPATKTPFTAKATYWPTGVVSRLWITEDGILHMKGGEYEGYITGISDPDMSGPFWYVQDLVLDLNTGEGSVNTKGTVSYPGGTFETSSVGEITPINATHSYFAGTSLGFGTGDYEGQIVFSSNEGEFALFIYPVEMDMEGIVLSPKG